MVVVDANLNVSAIGPGLSLYGGMIQVTPVSQVTDAFISLIGFVIFIFVWRLYPNNLSISKPKVKKSQPAVALNISKPKVKTYQPAVALNYAIVLFIILGAIILVSSTSYVTVILGLAIQTYAVKILVSRFLGTGTGDNFISVQYTYNLAVLDYTYLSATISEYHNVSKYQIIHIVFFARIMYLLYKEYVNIFFNVIGSLATKLFINIYVKNSIFLKIPRFVYVIFFYFIVNLIMNAPLICISESFVREMTDGAILNDFNDSTIVTSRNPVILGEVYKPVTSTNIPTSLLSTITDIPTIPTPPQSTMPGQGALPTIPDQVVMSTPTLPTPPVGDSVVSEPNHVENSIWGRSRDFISNIGQYFCCDQDNDAEMELQHIDSSATNQGRSIIVAQPEPVLQMVDNSSASLPVVNPQGQNVRDQLTSYATTESSAPTPVTQNFDHTPLEGTPTFEQAIRQARHEAFEHLHKRRVIVQPLTRRILADGVQTRLHDYEDPSNIEWPDDF